MRFGPNDDRVCARASVRWHGALPVTTGENVEPARSARGGRTENGGRDAREIPLDGFAGTVGWTDTDAAAETARGGYVRAREESDACVKGSASARLT